MATPESSNSENVFDSGLQKMKRKKEAEKKALVEAEEQRLKNGQKKKQAEINAYQRRKSIVKSARMPPKTPAKKLGPEPLDEKAGIGRFVEWVTNGSDVDLGKSCSLLVLGLEKFLIKKKK